MAAGCIRTLLLQGPKTSADQSIARHLLPRLIAFVTNTDTEDPENARSLVMHALTQFAISLPTSQKAAAMSLIVPTLLARANGEGVEERDVVFRETSARLLELAGSDQAAFRSVVGNMTDAQKGFMESVIVAGTQARETGKVPNGDEEGK